MKYSSFKLLLPVLVPLSSLLGSVHGALTGYIRFPDIAGESLGEAVNPTRPAGDDLGWFTFDSFKVAIDRPRASLTDANSGKCNVGSSGIGTRGGEKGGTADINIGVGELQECTISKSMDAASAKLAQFAINGNSLGTAEIDFVEVAGDGPSKGQPVCYLKYKLDRCFVKSWSTSGDADDRPTEEVAFYYNKIAFTYATTKDRSTPPKIYDMGWDNVCNVPWPDATFNDGDLYPFESTITL